MENYIRCKLVLVLGLVTTATLSAQPAAKGKAETAKVAKVSGFSDQAAFLFYLNGSLVLTNFVTWQKSGAFESKGEGVAEGEKIQMATTLSADPDGYWSEVWMQMPIHKTGVKRAGDTAIITLPDGATRKIPLKPGVLPFLGMAGLNLYPRYYDEAKGGKQKLPILIPHKKAEELWLEQKRRFPRTFSGKKIELREFELKAGDFMAVIWVDEDGRLIKSEQPDEGSMFIRQGFEGAVTRPGR